MKNGMSAAILLALAVSASSATAAALPSDLAKAAKAYDEAQAKGDRAALERLVADDYTLVNGGGEVEDKAAIIRDFTDPGYKLEPFTVQSPIEKVWNDGAVLGGIVTLKGVDNGKPFQTTFRFADIWARRNGAWRVIFTEVTRLPK